MLKVVVDTNIVVSALLKPYSNPALILSLIIQKKLKLYLSADIFNEYQEVLGYGKFKKINQSNVKKLLTHLKKNSTIITPAVFINTIKNHPADNKFLECAFAAKADFIITGNIKHFSFKSFRDIKIATPTEFLLSYAETAK